MSQETPPINDVGYDLIKKSDSLTPPGNWRLRREAHYEPHEPGQPPKLKNYFRWKPLFKSTDNNDVFNRKLCWLGFELEWGRWDEEKYVADFKAVRSRCPKLNVWWLAQKECEHIQNNWELIQQITPWPKYLVEQFNDRLGRPGRNRLWVDEASLGLERDQFAIDPWPETGEAVDLLAQGDYAGIVFKPEDMKCVEQQVGIITDNELNVIQHTPVDYEPPPTPQVQPEPVVNTAGITGQIYASRSNGQG